MKKNRRLNKRKRRRENPIKREDVTVETEPVDDGAMEGVKIKTVFPTQQRKLITPAEARLEKQLRGFNSKRLRQIRDGNKGDANNVVQNRSGGTDVTG